MQEELKASLPKIEGLLDYSIEECAEDEDNLAEELDPGRDQKNLRPYMITQHFLSKVPDLSDQILDPISDAVFAAVRKAVKNVPYFSFMGVVEKEAE